MALDERFVVSSDIEQLYRNKDTGLPLSNGTLKFYRDTARNEPKPVYQITGNPPNYTYTSMGSVINLSAVGTVQNQGQDNEVIYWFPYDGTPEDSQGNVDLYYVVCEDSAGTVQFTREGWPNVTAANSPQDQTNQNFENQISNPTFTNTFLNQNIDNVFSFTSATGLPKDDIPIAPDWNLRVTGTGNVTLKLIPLHGSQNIPSSPPFALDIIVASGISGCLLVQRFPKNSGLWSSTTDKDLYLYGSFVAENQNGGTGGILMKYQESTPGYSPVLVVNGSFTTPYEIVKGISSRIQPSLNSDPDGYVEIFLQFSTQSHTRITALQVIPSVGLPASIFSEDLNSSNRNEAFQGDYYIPRASKKTQSSYLTGWDFPVNPFQFANSGSILTTADYICDQTIACAKTNNVTWSRDPVTKGLHFTTTGTNDAFYIMQYLSGAEVKEMLGNRMSVNVFGYQKDTKANITSKIYLYRSKLTPVSAPMIPILPTTIGDIATDGTFTLSVLAGANGWTEIPRSGLKTPTFDLNKSVLNADIYSDKNDYGFQGYELTSETDLADTEYFAIVVTFKYTDTNTQFTINSISLTAGDLPCRPNPETVSEVLSKCQYYYEKSYNVDTYVAKAPNTGPSTGIGAIIAPQLVHTQYNQFGSPNPNIISYVYLGYFTVNFNTKKRNIGYLLHIYAQDGGAYANVWFFSYYSDSSLYLAANISTSLYGFTSSQSGFTMIPINPFTIIATNAPAGETRYTASASIYFHYVCDARYGIV